MAKDRFMVGCNIPDFDEFLKSKGVSSDDERIPLLKETWNQGIESACLYFGNQEGVDYRTMKTVKVP